MNYFLSEHARTRLKERGISETELDRVIQKPQQVIVQADGTSAYQSLIVRGTRIVMLRAFVDDRLDPATVISAYITTKPGYWSGENDEI